MPKPYTGGFVRRPRKRSSVAKGIKRSKPRKICSLCGNRRTICPGCSGLSNTNFAACKIGCGEEIRCPQCVSFEGALSDADTLKRIYWDFSEAANQIREEVWWEIHDAIYDKYRT